MEESGRVNGLRKKAACFFFTAYSIFVRNDSTVKKWASMTMRIVDALLRAKRGDLFQFLDLLFHRTCALGVEFPFLGIQSAGSSRRNTPACTRFSSATMKRIARTSSSLYEF